MKRLLSMFLVLGAFFFFTQTDAEAHRRGFKRRGKGGCVKMLIKAPSWKLKKKLSMTDAQIAQLKTIRSNFVTQAVPLKGQIKLQRFAMRQLMDNQNVDQAKVLAAVGKMNTLRGKMKLLAMQTKLQIRALLTAQQRIQLRQTCKAKKFRKFRRFRRWGHGGRGWGHKRHAWKRHYGQGPSSQPKSGELSQ